MAINYRDYDGEKDVLLDFVNKLEEYVKPLDPIHRVKNFEGYADLSLKEMLENAEKYNGKILLAEDAGKVIGCAIGAIWNQSEKNRLEIGLHKLGEILFIYIDEEYRGQGIGKTMLQMMENYFKENGCDSVWIVVFSPNENAHNMYKNFGFMDREIGMLKQI